MVVVCKPFVYVLKNDHSGCVFYKSAFAVSNVSCHIDGCFMFFSGYNMSFACCFNVHMHVLFVLLKVKLDKTLNA